MVRKTNVASGDDRVAIQVGKVGRSPRRADRTETETPATGTPSTGGERVSNVRRGNARVGRQVDVITGDLNIS